MRYPHQINRSPWSRLLLGTLFCITAVVVVGGTARAAEGPSFGTEVNVNDGSGVLVDTVKRDAVASVRSSSDATSKTAVTIKGPSSGSGTRVKTWFLFGKAATLNNGRVFPLAKIQTTVSYTVQTEAYTEKIWSYDFDRYFNICVKGLKDVTAQGGSVYCEVYHSSRVRYRQSSRILKNYPRPKVLSVTGSWVNPICQVGATNVDTSLPTVNQNQSCLDGQTEGNPNADVADCSPYSDYPRSTATTALIPQQSGRSVKVTTTTYACNDGVKGPGWATVSTTPLPDPTVTVTSITGPSVGGYYTIQGTLVNNYRKACWFDISIVNTIGGAHTGAYITSASPGAVVTWEASYWSSSSYGVPTTTATGAAAVTCKLGF